jgi:hypothetical protein
VHLPHRVQLKRRRRSRLLVQVHVALPPNFQTALFKFVNGMASSCLQVEGVVIDENDEGDAAEEQKAPVWVLEDACRHGYPPTPLPACPSARELC